MNKLITTFFLFLLPGFVLADGSGALSFAPPPSDYSIVFLGNLFGVVGGVLSGTGSQIMGTMFGVFNAAILAIGGIIILYTLIVSTMNTAHEGQMLGQKWSSIWIPLRTTIGLALLIPMASGYCLMQVIVMWIVVQGVGAADKIWDAALSYLNRGGVIIQAQRTNPTDALLNPGGGLGEIAEGVRKILPAQVCMLGLQQKLEDQRKVLEEKGYCKAEIGSPFYVLCKTPVPDFLGSVQPVAYQNANPTADPKTGAWKLDMPNLSDSPYAFLNGICGSLSWKAITSLNGKLANVAPDKDNNYTPGNNVSYQVGQGNKEEDLSKLTLTPSERQATQMSRAIALQQMYLNLSVLARTMINNDPAFSSNNKGTDNASANAIQQFGVPYTKEGTVCANVSQSCVLWGPSPLKNGGTLFNGTELINAVNTYNAVMAPVVNLSVILDSNKDSAAARQFINDASTRGWIMAGSYFFNLMSIQGESSTKNANNSDINTGLNDSTFNVSNLTSPFNAGNCVKGGTADSDKDFSQLCVWFEQDNTEILKISNLINTKPPITDKNIITSLDGSSTVAGFLNNGFSVKTPGQPGAEELTFANTVNLNVNTTPQLLEPQDFDCGPIKFLRVTLVCMGKLMGDVLYNHILLHILNIFMKWFGQFIQQFVLAIIVVPLTGMAVIFKQGLDIIAKPGVNPVIALANMGNFYINFSCNLWITLVFLASTPILNEIVLPVILLGMPLIGAWVAIMLIIGFLTAFFIPIMPYMIFTFGSIGWLMSVIESMVAAPIVALGITHPEGHDAFGKGEHSILILLNVFLRPSMMIIGYIAGIALTFVGIWVLNAGFDQAISFIQSARIPDASTQTKALLPQGSPYSNWTSIFAYFFAILTYTMMYTIIVQKAFELISALPDKVLRWIGGPAEGMGGETSKWSEEAKGQIKDSGTSTQKAMGAITGNKGQLAAGAADLVDTMKGKAGGEGESEVKPGNDNSQSGPPSTPAPPGGGAGGGGAAGGAAGGGAAAGGVAAAT